MRDINNLKNAFGEADDGFKTNVYRTLAALQKREERKPVKKISLRLAVIIVIACMMITTTALARSNTWGIFDFLSGRRIDVEVLPDAADIVQKEVRQESENEKSEIASFLVREAAFDGQGVFVVVEVKPADPDYLLLGPDAMLSDPIGNMGPLFRDETGTIADYARKNNKIPIRTAASIKELSSYSADFILEDDGTLVYMFIGEYDDIDVSGLDLHLNCVAAPFVEESIDTQNLQRIELSFALQNTGTKDDSVANVASAVYSDCGVRVDKITLTGSSMAIYAEIEFTVIDEGKFAATDGGLWFEFIDENGNRLPGGATSGSSSELTGESGVRYIQKDSLQAAEVMPGEIILRGYNCWDKNRYETHTFEMK